VPLRPSVRRVVAVVLFLFARPRSVAVSFSVSAVAVSLPPLSTTSSCAPVVEEKDEELSAWVEYEIPAMTSLCVEPRSF
jgi:hypothetical protein